MPFKYILDPSSKKFFCPGCEKKRLVRYIDSQTGKYCNDEYGRCDREVNCGYHKAPDGAQRINNIEITRQKPPYYIHKSTFQKTLTSYHQNNLFLFLAKLFGEQKAMSLILHYQIGTSKKWDGSTILWQINSRGQIGQGKIMLFDKDTGKRIKEPFPYISSVHKQLDKQDQKPEYCFFGEHLLLSHPKLPIAIVESEKTALIMAEIETSYLWIASGGLSQLTNRRLQIYKDRKIVFYPDLGGFEKWDQKAKELNQIGYDIVTSTLLEEKATEEDKANGFDIADYFIKNKLKTQEISFEVEFLINKNPLLQTLIDQFQLVQTNL
jgi:hypothetical protein